MTTGGLRGMTVGVTSRATRASHHRANPSNIHRICDGTGNATHPTLVVACRGRGERPTHWGSRPPNRSCDEDVGGSRAPWHREEPRKTKLPIFSGKDMQGWLVRVDRYFIVNEICENERSKLIFVPPERTARWASDGIY